MGVPQLQLLDTQTVRNIPSPTSLKPPVSPGILLARLYAILAVRPACCKSGASNKSYSKTTKKKSGHMAALISTAKTGDSVQALYVGCHCLDFLPAHVAGGIAHHPGSVIVALTRFKGI